MGALGKYKIIELYFNFQKQIGPVHWYYPKPSKDVLTVHPDNRKARKLFGLRHGFKVFTGARYLGGFIGDDESKCDWLLDHTIKW